MTEPQPKHSSRPRSRRVTARQLRGRGLANGLYAALAVCLLANAGGCGLLGDDASNGTPTQAPSDTEQAPSDTEDDGQSAPKRDRPIPDELFCGVPGSERSYTLKRINGETEVSSAGRAAFESVGRYGVTAQTSGADVLTRSRLHIDIGRNPKTDSNDAWVEVQTLDNNRQPKLTRIYSFNEWDNINYRNYRDLCKILPRLVYDYADRDYADRESFVATPVDAPTRDAPPSQAARTQVEFRPLQGAAPLFHGLYENWPPAVDDTLSGHVEAAKELSNTLAKLALESEIFSCLETDVGGTINKTYGAVHEQDKSWVIYDHQADQLRTLGNQDAKDALDGLERIDLRILCAAIPR